MSTLSDYEELVDSTITNKTIDYSITPQNVGDMLKELAGIVPELASSQSVPMGTILMYSPISTAEFDASGLGIADNVLGWAICNGSNTTPDLRGKFVVGYNPSDADYNVIGETGGQKYVTDVLSHNHFIAVTTGQVSNPEISSTTSMASIANYGNDSNYVLGGVSSEPEVGKTSTDGAIQPDNRPPYYTVLYIKKIA